MNSRSTLQKQLCLLLMLGCSLHVFSQNNDDDNDNKPLKKSKFLSGFYVGSYFANKYSASNYNGYGFALDGTRNSFANSLIYQKIINEYGGGYGQHDQIADALGVDQHQWTFNESDMPTNMHYTPSILVGLNFKLPVLKRSSFTFNLNGSKLGVEGNFTLELLKPSYTNPNPALNNNIQICTIRGSEQRLLFQVGFQQIFGGDDKFNFFGEVGLIGTLAKYNSNTIYINNLQIDLTNYWNQAIYPSASGPARKPVGFGIGAYGCLGANFEMNTKFTMQFLYTLSQEKVNFGPSPTLKFQNGVGFRVYYKI